MFRFHKPNPMLGPTEKPNYILTFNGVSVGYTWDYILSCARKRTDIIVAPYPTTSTVEEWWVAIIPVWEGDKVIADLYVGLTSPDGQHGSLRYDGTYDMLSREEDKYIPCSFKALN